MPKEYRLDADEVRMRREGRKIGVEPIPKDWAWLLKVIGAVDADFEAAVNEEVSMPRDKLELDFSK